MPSSPRFPSALEMIGSLLATPSVSSTNPAHDMANLEVIELLANWLDDMGFRINIQPLEHGKANLVATLGSGDPGKSLIFSGHTDTVPYDLEQWTTDPFRMRQKNNRLYGLGSTDMKSFFALVIEAIRQFDPGHLENPVTIIATADEESSMSGAKALSALQQSPGRFAVIGEPTSLRPIRMHKGVMMESIRITGQAGHSSDPALGASATEGMHVALACILDWRRELQEKYHNPLFHVAVPTLNIGSIHGGNNPNRICGHCETQIDVRPLPGMQLEELRAELGRRLEKCLASHAGLKLEFSPLFEGIPAHETPADSPIVKASEQHAGAPAEAVAFGTEAPFFANLGIDTVIMGPGNINQAHQADEYLELDQIKPAIQLASGLIHHFCCRR